MTPLSDLELRVLATVADGHPNTAAARLLGLSKASVADRLREVRRKLGATTTAHAVHLAHRRGLLDQPIPAPACGGFETVKPLDLMRWLVRLLTPPGGRVLDMYPGTGTTGQAAQLEGFASVLVEKEAAHIAFIRERLAQHVRVDPRTDEAVPVAPDPEGALSLFEIGSAS